MRDVFRYLGLYSTQPVEIDRLIVSSFIEINNLSKKENKVLQAYIITQNEKDKYTSLQEFIKIIRKEKEFFEIEDLIEIFEFVVSPEEKIVTGAVYTPANIRNYIVEQSLSSIIDYTNVKICDPACGCSGFLYTAAKFIKRKTKRTYSEIFSENIYGLDIQEYSITRSKLLLSLFVLSQGEFEDLEFNLFHGNALNFNWAKCIKNFSGFQVIVGNPPYVCSRNMDKETLSLLKSWSVTKSGHPDLYIPFFQIGFENLAANGILGLITVNTFIKSINGRALRQYFADESAEFKIINFGGEQIFKDKNTYTCLCFLKKSVGAIQYRRIESSFLEKLQDRDFLKFTYAELNHHDGWNLVDTNEKNEFIRKIEAVGKPFKELFNTRNGIATLKNEVYKFTPTKQDTDFYYFVKDDQEYAIEKGICRRIVNANKVKTDADLKKMEEKIIFPYRQVGTEIHIMHETELKNSYPNTLRYLRDQKGILAKRDKSKTEDYEKWYAYGRRQSMDTYAYKLFFPHICERPTFVISKDRELLFYNGIAVISDSLKELIELKSLLESDVFFDYIKSTTKNYSSGYISMSRNYIKNFGIANLSEDEKTELNSLTTNANRFWNKIYKKRFRLNE